MKFPLSVGRVNLKLQILYVASFVGLSGEQMGICIGQMSAMLQIYSRAICMNYVIGDRAGGTWIGMHMCEHTYTHSPVLPDRTAPDVIHYTAAPHTHKHTLQDSVKENHTQPTTEPSLTIQTIHQRGEECVLRIQDINDVVFDGK